MCISLPHREGWGGAITHNAQSLPPSQGGLGWVSDAQTANSKPQIQLTASF